MKKFLLTSAAVVLATATHASTVNLTVLEPGQAGLIQTVPCSGSVCTATTQITTFSYLVETFSGTSPPSTLAPFLLQGQSIVVGGGGSPACCNTVLHLTVSVDGLTSPTGLQTLISGFDITGVSAGWTVDESTDINGTTVGSAHFVGPLSSGQDTEFLNFNLTSPFTASIHFDISSNSIAGSANVGAALSAVPAPVPGPIAGAGLPGLILACGSLLGWWRRRQKIA
jgi:hypothetical protein